MRVTRVGLFLVLLVLDAARLSLRVLCMICRIRFVAVGPASALGDMGIAGACGEHDFDGRVVEFENLQLAALAEFGYLHCLNSENSSVCHSSMHAPSLAHVIDGAGGGVCELVSGVGVGNSLRGCGTARLDGLLHEVSRPFPACGEFTNSRAP